MTTKYLPKNLQRGFSLLELAIALGLMAIVLGPMLVLNKQLQASQAERQRMEARHTLAQAVDAFVVTHGRLPCPAPPHNGFESWDDGQCTHNPGWLPVHTLHLPGEQAANWRMAIAGLESAGEPAQHLLTKAQPWDSLSPAQLTEIIFNPITPSRPVGAGPLPAIHLCQFSPGIAAQNPSDYGCGAAPLLSPAAVLVLAPTPHPGQTNPNDGRSKQFYIDSTQPNLQPIWLGYERLNWLLAQHRGS